MHTHDEAVVVDVRLPEELVSDIDQFRRRSAHESRSAVVSAALARYGDDW